MRPHIRDGRKLQCSGVLRSSLQADDKQRMRTMYSVHMSPNFGLVEPWSLSGMHTASEDEEGFEESEMCFCGVWGI